MWHETALDIQKARKRLLHQHCQLRSPEYWTSGPGTGFEKGSLVFGDYFFPFLSIFSRTMESWRHRFFQNWHTPELYTVHCCLFVVVLQDQCCDCQATYISETGRNLSTRLTEHKRATRNGDVNNYFAKHHLQTKHQIDWDSNQSIIPSTDVIQLTLTLKMTTAQVVETSVTVNNNSPIQDNVHLDDQTEPTYEMTPGFKLLTN